MKKGIIAKRKMKELKKSGKELKCESCGNSNLDALTFDHIVPMAVLQNFGLTVEEMFEDKYLQIYCHSCNIRKNFHLDLKNPKTKELLLELLNKV